MIRLELLGPHTQLVSTLCAQCPQGSTGCCKAPPDVDWVDIARIVFLGGRDWLLEQIARGNLLAFDRGLRLRRIRKRTSPTDARTLRCVYHGSTGCTISTSNRPATCNYFLCEDTFVEAGEAKGNPEAIAARRAWHALRKINHAYDQHMDDFVRSGWPEGPPWNAEFLDSLGTEFSRLEQLRPESPELTTTNSNASP